VTDPLDAQFRFLRQNGVTTTNTVRDFERDEFTGRFDVGYVGGRVDASVGYEYYDLSFEDREFEQAAHHRHTYRGEVGTELPFWAQKRGYVRGQYNEYRFEDASILSLGGAKVGEAQRLNDADQYSVWTGVEGNFFSQKIRALAEIGYTSWEPDTGSGSSADTNSYNGIIGAFKVAYRPWEERDTTFSIRYERAVGYSSISNYNADHHVELSVVHELMPERRLMGDASFSFTRTEPSDGPDRALYQLGVGVEYKLFEQLTASARYLTRYQEAGNEIIVNSAFSTGGQTFGYVLHSDGDFWQNIFEVGLTLKF
jgi:hypothetical protein